MQKIMFNKRFGLEQGVIAGTKTMTRRIIKKLNHTLVTEISDWGIDDRGRCYLTITYSTGLTEDVYSSYQIGEEIAIAQPYKDICLTDPIFFEGLRQEAGWKNKMFVKAEYMPHRICITDIKVERLQDISNYDCLREGIFFYKQPPLHHEYDRYAPWPPNVKAYKYDYVNLRYFYSPRAAFHCLIDRLNGCGTWNRNEWQFAYTFKLIK